MATTPIKQTGRTPRPKLVQSFVEMVPACRKVLRAICDINGITVSAYLYDVARLEIHKQAVCCPMAMHVLTMFNKEIDKRVYKPCSGFHCQLCAHKEACALGQTDKLFAFSDNALEGLEDAGYVSSVTYQEVTRVEPIITLTRMDPT